MASGRPFWRDLLEVGAVVKPGMMAIDGERNWPKLMFQGQSGPVGSVRTFVARVLLAGSDCFHPVLKGIFCLTYVMEQTGQFAIHFALKVCGKLFRSACHADKMLDK